ncbi:unnamed protein product [Durusdinium trenchii]|uniref:ATP-grasp domain-containing protein n=1 Tax=Durusdinium trenchii TaxID=1381693 RepID=A0ABP0N1Z8_9DINO
MAETRRVRHRRMIVLWMGVLVAALATRNRGSSTKPAFSRLTQTPGGTPYEKLWENGVRSLEEYDRESRTLFCGSYATKGMTAPANSNLVSDTIKDKKMCEEILKLAGFPFLESILWATQEAKSMKNRLPWRDLAEETIGQFGLPMVVKPVRGSGGNDVKLARTKEELFKNCKDLAGKPQQFALLFQPYFNASSEVRVIVGTRVRNNATGLKVEPVVLGVVKKTLPKVTGDGSSTILELIDSMDMNAGIEHMREEFKKHMQCQGMLDMIPGEGTDVAVYWKFNQVQGGAAVPMDLLADGWESLTQLALKAAREVTLGIGSVDILVSEEGDARIVEMNEYVLTDLMDILPEETFNKTIADQIRVALQINEEMYRLAGEVTQKEVQKMTYDKQQPMNAEVESQKERTYEEKSRNQVAILKGIAKKHNMDLTLLSQGFVQFFKDISGMSMQRNLKQHGSLNTPATSDVTSDKVRTANLLEKAGLPVVPHKEPLLEEDFDAALAEIESLQEGDPQGRVVIKGRYGSGGISCRLCYEPLKVSDALLELHNPCVSPFIKEVVKEFRVFTNGGVVAAIYAKEFPYVVGDGDKTVNQLLDEYCEKRVGAFRYKDKLKKELRNASDIPEKCEQVPLTWKLNLAYGCEVSQVSLGEEPKVEELAASASKTLQVSGAVDILQLANGSFVVMEVNSNPGVDNLIRLNTPVAEFVLELRVLIDQRIRQMWLPSAIKKRARK